MSSTFKKLGIEYKQFSKDQIEDAVNQISSMRLEQILVGENELFDWDNIMQRPELISCKNTTSLNPELEEKSEIHFVQKTLLVFDKDDPFRKNVTLITNQKYFQYFLIFILVLNTVAFCLKGYKIGLEIEIACNVIFGIEIILKSVAQGFILDKNTYLRNKWNCLNVITFITTWLILIQDNNSALKVFLSFRLLRVIRFPQELPQLQNQFEAYIGSFLKLSIIVVPLIFFLIFFSVIGLHFFTGLTSYRCRIHEEPVDGVWVASEEVPYLCGIYECPEELTCGSPYKYGIEWDMAENDSEEFMWNFVRFDNVFNSLLVVFTYFCLIGWSETNYIFWKAMTTYVTAGYFALVLVFLAFIFSNLLLATFYESFIVKSSIKNSSQKSQKQQQRIESEINQKKQEQMMDRLALMSKSRKSVMNENKFSNFTLFFNEEQQQIKKTITFLNFSSHLTESIYFSIITNVIIILCTLSIVIDYDGMDQDMQQNLQIIEFICTIYFFFELIVIIMAQGIKQYFNKSIQIFDFLIIVSQAIILAGMYLFNEKIIYNENSTVQVLKAIKLFRLLKFLYGAKILYHMSVMTRSTIMAILQIKNMIGLWLIFVLFISLLGNNFLQNELTQEEAEFHYNNFGNSLISAFNIFYNEEWHITMYQFGRVTWLSFLYHIFGILFGQIIFMKLLAAIFLNEFIKQVKSIESILKPVQLQEAARGFIETLKNLTSQKAIQQNNNQRKRSTTTMDKAIIQNVRQGILRNLRMDKRLTKIVTPTKRQTDTNNLDFTEQINSSKPPLNEPEPENGELIQPQLITIQVKSKEPSVNLESNQVSQLSISQQKITPFKMTKQKTMFIFDDQNTFRKQIQNIIGSKLYKIIGLMIVGISAIRLILVTPTLDPLSDEFHSLDQLYIVLTSFYCLILIFHIVAHGLYGTPNAFLTQSYYNWINFAITLIELVTVCTQSKNHVFNFISSLRVLEFIKLGAELNHSLKCAQTALINALVKMIQLSIFCFIIFIIYGTFAMKKLKGLNYYCAGIDVEEYHIEDKLNCMDYGGSWCQYRLGFDNVLDSALTLFIFATTEGWSPILEQFWSLKGKDLEPEENYNRWWVIYFQIFFFLGNILMLNMFIGLVVNTYDESKLKAEGTAELDGNQREWHDIKKSIHKLQPKVKSRRPQNKIRRIAFFFVKNSTLKKVELMIIFINTLILCLYVQGQNNTQKQILDAINLFCICFFIIEIVARFIAKDFSIYFKEIINIIEITCIWICLAEKIITISFEVNFYFLRCFTAFSVSIQMLRNFRIVKRFNTIERLFHSIFSVIPNAISMIYIMFVFLFIYTSLGMDMFAYLKPQQYIDDFDVHFRKFSTAMFSLVRVASSEMWWKLLIDATHTQTADFACLYIDDYNGFKLNGYEGCGTKLAYLYFVSFHLIFSLVLLNLFIASILGAYEEHIKQEQSAISKYQLNDVLQYWAENDPLGTGFLNYKQFWKLSSQIAICFGVNSKDLLNPQNKKNFLKALNIPLYEDHSGLIGYLFHDVIQSLTKISVELKYGVKDLEKKNHKQTFYHSYYKKFKPTPYNSGQMNTIIYLQNKARTLINKKRGINFLNIEALKQELLLQAENQ